MFISREVIQVHYRMYINTITWEEDYRNLHGLLQSSPTLVITTINTFDLYHSSSKIIVVRFYTCTILISF